MTLTMALALTTRRTAARTGVGGARQGWARRRWAVPVAAGTQWDVHAPTVGDGSRRDVRAQPEGHAERLALTGLQHRNREAQPTARCAMQARAGTDKRQRARRQITCPQSTRRHVAAVSDRDPVGDERLGCATRVCVVLSMSIPQFPLRGPVPSDDLYDTSSNRYPPPATLGTDEPSSHEGQAADGIRLAVLTESIPLLPRREAGVGLVTDVVAVDEDTNNVIARTVGVHIGRRT